MNAKIVFQSGLVRSFVDVTSVYSDGRTLCVESGSTPPVALIPLKWVREIIGMDRA